MSHLRQTSNLVLSQNNQNTQRSVSHTKRSSASIMDKMAKSNYNYGQQQYLGGSEIVGSGGSFSPIANEKSKKLFPSKERLNQSKGYLAQKATQELDFHHSKYEIMRWNILKLDQREQFQTKNLRGLISYAKKLTVELDEYKEKVKMAEKIIQDLRNTGNESLDSLINMVNQYQLKQVQTQQEIQKLKQLIVLKDDELVGLDEDIIELSGFVSTAKGKLEVKIEDLLKTLEDNRRLIRRQDKIIVDLQQKNEVSQNAIAETADQALRKAGEKQKLQLKIRELEGRKTNIQESISNMESKIATFRTIQGGSQLTAQANTHHETQQLSIQWNDAPQVVGGVIPAYNGAGQQRYNQQVVNASSPLKPALSNKNNKQSNNAAQAADVEKFEDVIAEELKLGEWTFWEHYENLNNVKDSSGSQYLASQQKMAWFNDVISFWQVWNTLPYSNIKNFFLNLSTLALPTYDIKGEMKRISGISLFKKGIIPQWEDPVNKNGGEYQLQFRLGNQDEAELDSFNGIWENLVLDVVSKRFPNSDQLAGVRVVDKSQPGRSALRIEIWLTNKDPNNQQVKEIQEFIEKEYNKLETQSHSNFQWKSHVY